jgi:predicted transcriptional regulator
MTPDPTSNTHAQHVPAEFIPEGFIQVTNYTEEDLPALAEDIAADTDAPADEILENLENLLEYNVPVTAADRSARQKFGEGDL